jgi:hypothetical protein
LILVILLLSSSIAIAQDKTSTNICFDEETAKRMIVELEQGRILKEQLKVSEDIIQTYKEREQYWKDYVKGQDEIIKIQQRTIDQYKQLVKTQEEMYEKQLKDAKPTFWQKVGEVSSYVAIGVIVGVALGLAF